MAVNDLDRLRLYTADRPRLVLDEIMGYGDGARTFYEIQMVPINLDSEVIIVNSVAQVRDTDYSIDFDIGLVTFAAPVTADQLIKATKYTWTTFTDAELEDVLDRQGDDVVRASIDVIQWLLVDVERFMKYFLGQEMIDRNIGVKALEGMLERLQSIIGSPAEVILADTPELAAVMAPFIEDYCA